MSENQVPESQQFGNIVLGGKNAHREESVGVLRLHAGGIGWKSKVAGNVVPIQKADLRAAEWIKIPHAYQLKVRAKGGFVYRFNGFRGQDKETVKSYCTATFGLEVEDGALSYKGWNWGQASVEGGNIDFKVEGKPAFELPLTDIAQATAQKSEAVIEMVDDDTALDQDELLVEVRFHMPPRATGGEGADGEPDAAEAGGFVELIKQSGDLEVAGASLLNLEDLQVQVPRGRYDVELCDKFMKLHGKTNDYKVLYTNVASLYLLPKPDGVNMALIVSLEHPLRQGATSYPHIVFQLPRDDTLETEVMLSESECSARFGEKLDKFESGDLPSVTAKVLSAFTKRKVSGIKSGGFNAEVKDDRAKSIRCSLKAAEGFLYPLDKAFFFLSNKPVLVELDRVASVEFNRVDASGTANAARTFDITVHMKDMSSDLQFVNLQRSEYKELFRFLTAKKLRIKNIASSSYADGGRGDDDDDDDPYMARMQKEREAALAAEAEDDDDDDDDESDDEDFVAGDDSDVDEEYDEGDEEDDERMEKREKGKKDKGSSSSAPPKKRSRDDDASGSDDDDDDDSSGSEEEEKKPAKKGKKAMGIMGKKGASPKKKKAKKDADAPKRATTAYMLWMNTEGRAAAKAENPDLKVTEVGKRCGELWKAMDADAKAPWEEKAKADKVRYEAEMKEYKAKGKAAEESDDEPMAEASDSDSD